MKKLALVVTLIVSISCGEKSSENSSGMTDTNMTATIGGENYEVDVRYYLDDTSGLTVYSDKNDVTDSNGDGLVFAIFEFNGKLQFDFVENGERLGGSIVDWKKTDEKITGSGELRPEDGLGKGVPVNFTLHLLIRGIH